MLRSIFIVAGAVGLVGAAPAMAQSAMAQSAMPQSAMAPAATATSGAARPVPADWRVRGLDGTLHALSEWRGRVVILNMWASWCAPCVGEMESFRALRTSLRTSLRTDGLPADAVALLLLTPELASRVARFVRRRLPDLPVFVEHDPLPAGFGLRAVPTTWILDRDGRVVLAHRGAADWNSPAVRALLRSLASDRGAVASGSVIR